MKEGLFLEIRKSNTEDCSELTKLRIEMRKEREAEISDENQRIFRDNTFNFFKENISNGTFVAYLAIENNEVIATSGLCFYSVPPTYSNINGKVAYIMNMYTKPQFRRRGIATRLLDYLVNEAKAKNCTKITLNASDMGKPIYLKYGFKDIENDMVYYIK